ncbi:hypothetical protein Q0Z83_031060 [Actinoplanes sichuanensis]|uniref:Uncharacterized protein n=1 Tax=Actinoplanes sichuanensis TaxID=512349 RepID=A0ABW4ARL9_9ACTN|nr:hypothetical protein [Actinoplanes sichuanensis]BEL04915.1 hypothetical protein Q0Z83_031060 [Actinoplanes sichuanensis]
MTDHWDHHDDDAFGFDLPDDHVPLHEPLDHGAHDTWDLPDVDDAPPVPEVVDVPDEVAAVTVDDGVFPPALEVDLPEPVDGFPWIDPTTLGAADPTGFLPPVENVTAHELASYAGIEIPDGADPWAVLAASDDPATAALARWWTTGEQ